MVQVFSDTGSARVFPLSNYTWKKTMIVLEIVNFRNDELDVDTSDLYKLAKKRIRILRNETIHWFIKNDNTKRNDANKEYSKSK